MQLNIKHFLNSFHNADTSILHPHGDDITNLTSKHITRLGFQNIRGIDRYPEPATELIQTIKDYDIDIFGAAETNCDWTQDFKHAVHTILQKTFGNALLSTSSA